MIRELRTASRRAQSIMEYTIVLGVITLVLFAMSRYVQRGAQGMIKVVADQLGVQNQSDQSFNEDGVVLEAYTASRVSTDMRRTEQVGVFGYEYNDRYETFTNSLTNMGFTEQRGL